MPHQPTPTTRGVPHRRTRHRRARRRILAASVVLLAAVAMIAASARADSIVVTDIHAAPANGAVSATVTAAGPLDSAIAIDLFRHACPTQPPIVDFVPGLDAEGQPVPLLANPPSMGATGVFKLCVWIQHEDGEIGARYEHSAQIPAAHAARGHRHHRHHRAATGGLEGGTLPAGDPGIEVSSS